MGQMEEDVEMKEGMAIGEDFENEDSENEDSEIEGSENKGSGNDAAAVFFFFESIQHFIRVKAFLKPINKWLRINVHTVQGSHCWYMLDQERAT